LGRNVAIALSLSFLIASFIVIATSSASTDMIENSWTTKATMKEARAYFGVAVVNGKIYAIGGGTGSPVGNGPGPTVGTSHVTPVVNTTEEYDPATDKWTMKTQMPTARICVGVAVVNDTFYVIGGRSGEWTYITIMDASAVTEQYVPFGYDFTQPKIVVQSPENKTYTVTDASLSFTVNEAVSWMRYSLDNQDNVTISGNTTLTGLAYGTHNITVYAIDIAGNVGSSETTVFTVAKPELFPTTIVAVASGAFAIAIGAGLLIYFKKFKKRQ
jgi:hypothetical protein